MIHCVEVQAFYENRGVAPTPQRLADRDADFALAVTRAGQVSHTVPSQTDEYMVKFDPPDKYGTGWRCRQWIQTQADAAAVGQALFNRLSTRGLQNGSKIQVFPLDETQPANVYVTGPVSYQRKWPTPNPEDVG